MRTDREMMETYESCVQTDFRHHTWVRCERWDRIAWQSIGYLHAANDEQYAESFGPTYQLQLRLLIDGVEQDPEIDRTLAQLDCHTVSGTAAQLEYTQIAVMLASLQWALGIKCHNTGNREMNIALQIGFSDRQRLTKTLPEETSRHLVVEDEFISYLIAYDRRPRVTVQDHGLSLQWEASVRPGDRFSVGLAFRSGWGDAMVDRTRSARMNYNVADKMQKNIMAKAQELEFDQALKLLDVNDRELGYDCLERIAQRKQTMLDAKTPRLSDFPDNWEGAFRYTLDLLRAGVKAPQGLCDDIWMAADPMFYVWTFYWDTAAAAHSFCELDAAAAARTLLTFLRGGIQEDGSSMLQFNPVYEYHFRRPQLMNIPLALWDCYRITRDVRIIGQAYPLLARHQQWIDTVWNKRPEGPICDLDWNIDYGCALHDQRHIWLDVVTFQVSQYEHLAKMEDVLGLATEHRWQDKAERLKAAIKQYMWDETDKVYYCLKSSDLTVTRVALPIEFYLMTAGIASRQEAEHLVDRLMDPGKYAPGGIGNYFCPSVSYDDPTFAIMAENGGGWGGNIWLIEAYYTVCGLVRYGFQQEAAAVARNLFGMVADEYARTGTIWEQYNPADGTGIHLKYFTSGISSNIVELLIRGMFGFERTDQPDAFYLTPCPAKKEWHGVRNLTLCGERKLDIAMRDRGDAAACKVKLTGIPHAAVVRISCIHFLSGAEEPICMVPFDEHGEAIALLPYGNQCRYLWQIEFTGDGPSA